jgi:hypothetical protein
MTGAGAAGLPQVIPAARLDCLQGGRKFKKIAVRRDWPGTDSCTGAICQWNVRQIEPIKGGNDQSPKFDRDGERRVRL